MNIDALGDGYNGGRFSQRSYSISSNSSTNTINPSSLVKSHNPNHHLYSSQQNLSTNTRNSKNNNTHNNTGNYYTTHTESNFNRTKVYGSISNLEVLQKNLGNTEFMTSQKNNNYKNVNMTATPVDNWLNAWDNPPPEIEQRATPVAAKPIFHNNNNTKHYNFSGSNFNKPITIPLKPLQLKQNVQRTDKLNDPWAGDFIFYFLFINFLYHLFLYKEEFDFFDFNLVSNLTYFSNSQKEFYVFKGYKIIVKIGPCIFSIVYVHIQNIFIHLPI